MSKWLNCGLMIACMAIAIARTAAQELYPMTETASNIPKGALGIRMFDESYKEVNQLRNLFGVKVMYGVLPRLTIIASATVSNHHNQTLPPEFPEHNTPQVGVKHPYLLNGVDIYAKYRFLSLDGEHRHYRMAAYAEYSYLGVAHDEAEPTLLDDTKGFGAGVIATYLNGHFAASATGGIILPSKYEGIVPDEIAGLPSVPAEVRYSKGYNYSLSLGYLLLPRKYENFEQTNWNVYLEILGKTYDAVKVNVGNINYTGPLYSIRTSSNKALQKNNFIEVHPGLQCIIRSNLRMDASVGFPLIGKSYVRYYPVYTIGIQRYFYFKHHAGRKV